MVKMSCFMLYIFYHSKKTLLEPEPEPHMVIGGSFLSRDEGRDINTSIQDQGEEECPSKV